MKILILLISALVTQLSQGENLTPSVYYITQSDSDSENCATMRSLLDEGGKPLAKVCKDFFKRCILEGTCKIIEGDSSFILNYTQTIQDIPRFVKIDSDRCPYGLGVSQICLDPFYTVAADLNYHKAGDVLFIDKLKGIKLPNNEVHTGYVIVRDRGGGIKGPNRFDFFTGTFEYTDPKNSVSQQGFSSTTNHYPYEKIIGTKAEEIRKLRNFPLLPKNLNFQNSLGK